MQNYSRSSANSLRKGISKQSGLGSKLLSGGKWLTRNMFHGNELEGAEFAAQNVMGYSPGLASIPAHLGFDLARPYLAKGIRRADRAIGDNFAGWTESGLRDGLQKGQKFVTRYSNYAPKLQAYGQMQEKFLGFNQFDPKRSIEEGKKRTLDTVAETMGWDSVGEMRADAAEFRPVLGLARGLLNRASKGVNAYRSDDLLGRLQSLSDDQYDAVANDAYSMFGNAMSTRGRGSQLALLNEAARRRFGEYTE